MRLQITHETLYDYAPPVDVAQHIACLQPMQSACQDLLSHHLEVTPVPSQHKTTRDVFGNLRTFISLQIPHNQLKVIAISTVDTRSRAAPPADLPWEQVREHYRYRAGASFDANAQFVFPSPYVPRHAQFADYARPSFTPATGLLAACADLMHRMHADFTYDNESTEIHTPALQALEQRKGVCQDFAHIMLACLRSLGLASRYVSGYLLTHPAPGTPRLIGQDASHAWVSVALPGLDEENCWFDFDPTNDRRGWGTPGEDYVLLAVGRDFADVSPIRGVLHGGANHELAVAVTVAPLDESNAPLCASHLAPIPAD